MRICRWHLTWISPCQMMMHWRSLQRPNDCPDCVWSWVTFWSVFIRYRIPRKTMKNAHICILYVYIYNYILLFIYLFIHSFVIVVYSKTSHQEELWPGNAWFYGRIWGISALVQPEMVLFVPIQFGKFMGGAKPNQVGDFVGIQLHSQDDVPRPSNYQT